MAIAKFNLSSEIFIMVMALFFNFLKMDEKWKFIVLVFYLLFMCLFVKYVTVDGLKFLPAEPALGLLLSLSLLKKREKSHSIPLSLRSISCKIGLSSSLFLSHSGVGEIIILVSQSLS